MICEDLNSIIFGNGNSQDLGSIRLLSRDHLAILKLGGTYIISLAHHAFKQVVLLFVVRDLVL